jgi:Malectin domain
VSHVFFSSLQSWWYGGARVFDVVVAGTKTIANLDLHGLSGKDAAYTTTLAVTTTGPTLTIVMLASKDKAKISAIEIHAAAIGSNSGPLLIDCGSSSSYTDSQSRLWLADVYFDAESGVYNTSSAITNTAEDTLYQTERTGVKVTYSIPRPPGTYAVTLHFAEI